MGLKEELETAAREGAEAFAAAADEEALEEVRIAWLGRQGRLKELGQAFASLEPSEKPAVGAVLAATKKALTDAFEKRRRALADTGGDPPIDVTLPVARPHRGATHPIAQVGAEVERVFAGMGFDVVDGPHVELDLYNFSRLNIPEDHPARDSHDTFWLEGDLLLRTHTSAVQSRIYELEEPPLRKVVIGKVFRYEEIDATHDNTFNQVEGFVVDEGIHVGHLVATVKAMIRGVLGGDDVELRVRPSYFPFVEPGFEVDVRAPAKGGAFADWVELLGCGLVHPRVLEMGGIDPDRYSGFAFGLGLERLAMIRHGIDDIRLFHGADLRGLRQFA